ncbi:Pentatricopeptide repeat-containing protein, chloroplastic [Ananas comosus]|uniref:Pentatricopeptide repeat-containing protein, chloroplastic n=1 Tax=Ananas comosus TaxID=4615 RepID=A0A199UDE7_ANACO|nr:Pentatricopeptide repeat-containing protein, chloroplastic [Ananas comosus]
MASIYTKSAPIPFSPKPPKPKTLNPFPNPVLPQISPKKSSTLSSPTPNAITTTSSSSDLNLHIRRLCVHGHLHQAILLLDSSSTEDPLEETTYVALLRLCEWKRAVAEGSRVYSHIDSTSAHLTLRLGNALLSMFVRFGNLLVAWSVFGKMVQRDVFSWNVMVGGYGKAGFMEEALDLYQRMIWAGIVPDVYTFPCVLRSCGGKEIHGYAIKKDFIADVSVHNALIQMYSSLGRLSEAEKIFSRMEFKDVVSWTAMISGYEKNGSPSKALEVYEVMEAQNMKPDEVTIASVLAACACLGRLDIGIKLHELARSKGLVPYTIVGNTLVDMYSKSRCIDKAIEVFKHMPEKDVISWSSIISGFRINHRSFEALSFFRRMQANVKPNSITFIAALSACAAVGALMCGKEIHAQALRNGLGSEGYLANALLDLYAKCGRTKYAWSQFNIQEKKDVVSWNIMLTGYAGRGQGDLAVQLFDWMVDAGVKPDEVTFVALLCACSRCGLVSQGWNFFNSMSKNYSIVPNLKHYACMVDLLGRAGLLEEAHRFIKEMPIEPDAAIWGALLNGCRIHRNIELGELAAEFIFNLESEKIGYYILLCNLYADGGRWDQVARVRKMMRDKELEIDPGCSWVEVKGTVHAFLSGDESHPQIKEINAVLGGLYGRIKAAGYFLEDQSSNDLEESKSDIFCGHSERLAVSFGLINSVPGTPIWVTKNLYMCQRCHRILKLISKVVRRDITVRDTEQFHHFKDGKCSCGDEGKGGQVEILTIHSNKDPKAPSLNGTTPQSTPRASNEYSSLTL